MLRSETLRQCPPPPPHACFVNSRMESFQMGTPHSLGTVKTWARPARGKECVRYTTLTPETPITPRVAFSWLESQIWSGRTQTGAPHHGISMRLIYKGYFQLSPHWLPLTSHTSRWCDIANMVMILHGKWPQRHLSNQSRRRMCILPVQAPTKQSPKWLVLFSIHWTLNTLVSAGPPAFSPHLTTQVFGLWTNIRLTFTTWRELVPILTSKIHFRDYFLEQPMYFLPYWYVHFVLWVLLIGSLKQPAFWSCCNIPQHSVLMNIHQWAKKKEGNPNWKWFVLRHTKQGFVIEVWRKIRPHRFFRRVCE